jgi:hypothetical protein
MLGLMLGDDKRKITSQRVLDATGPKIEVSFSAVGTYAGIDCTNTGTYWTIPIAADTLYGEGNGVLMPKNDLDMLSWTARGIGSITGPGKARFRGSVFFKTSLTGKLSTLNNLVGVFEYEIDASVNTSIQIWEWK